MKAPSHLRGRRQPAPQPRHSSRQFPAGHRAALHAESIPQFDYARDLGDPGAYPYTRGIHPSGYRGKLWTMRQFAGFGTPEDTNRRYRELLAAGATGLSVAFDLPTLMGRDPAPSVSLGEVGEVRREL
jgi:methylmalonyl-CoA mutase N-terminal domain/subunit